MEADVGKHSFNELKLFYPQITQIPADFWDFLGFKDCFLEFGFALSEKK
jgi:hypothetical protein